MKHLLYAIVACTIIFQACKKDKDEVKDDTKPATEDLEMKRITAHQWLIYRLDVSGTDFWNFPGAIQTCTKDDSYRFYKDSMLVQYENSKVCTGGTDSTVSNWEFYDNKKKLIGTILGLTDTADVVSIQDTLMQLSLNYQGSPALIYFRKK